MTGRGQWTDPPDGLTEHKSTITAITHHSAASLVVEVEGIVAERLAALDADENVCRVLGKGLLEVLLDVAPLLLGLGRVHAAVRHFAFTRGQRERAREREQREQRENRKREQRESREKERTERESEQRERERERERE